jgi:hypothetical protein
LLRFRSRLVSPVGAALLFKFDLMAAKLLFARCEAGNEVPFDLRGEAHCVEVRLMSPPLDALHKSSTGGAEFGFNAHAGESRLCQKK